MNNSKIKIRVTRFYKSVAIEILYMDEKFREEDGIYFSSNGITIKSANYPEYKESERTLYLRGVDKEDDMLPIYEKFETTAERDVFIVRILSALKEWSENWAGFEDDNDEEYKNDINSSYTEYEF